MSVKGQITKVDRGRRNKTVDTLTKVQEQLNAEMLTRGQERMTTVRARGETNRLRELEDAVRSGDRSGEAEDALFHLRAWTRVEALLDAALAELGPLTERDRHPDAFAHTMYTYVKDLSERACGFAGRYEERFKLKAD